MTDSETQTPGGQHLLDLSKPPPRNERWSLLLVGASGRIVRVRRIRGWLTLLVALPVFILALAAGVYLRADSRGGGDMWAKRRIARLRAQVGALTDENERLTTRIAARDKGRDPVPPASPAPGPQPVATPPAVTATTPPAETGTTPPEETGTTPPVEAGAAPPAETAPTFAEDGALAVEDRQPVVSAADSGSGSADRLSALPDAVMSQFVEVKDLVVSLDHELSSVRVRFKIINRLPEGETFSGYAFVFLKPDKKEAAQWLSFPAAVLEAGVPVSYKSGYDFNISNFMYIRFKPRRVGSVDAFQTATVIIYSASGRLLLSSDFQLNPRR